MHKAESSSERDESSMFSGPLEQAVRLGKPGDMSKEEEEAFVEFLRATLKWEASERPSAEKLMEMKWLTENWN
jgi:hypothetical protein